MGHMPSTGTSDFNPYKDASPSTTGSLKSSQSMPEPMLESHFNAGRPPFQTSPSFQASQNQPFSQLNLGNYTQTNPGGGFVPRNTPPKQQDHQQQQQQQQQFFASSNDEMNGKFFLI
jgi:hypothetical protein